MSYLADVLAAQCHLPPPALHSVTHPGRLWGCSGPERPVLCVRPALPRAVFLHGDAAWFGCVLSLWRCGGWPRGCTWNPGTPDTTGLWGQGCPWELLNDLLVPRVLKR